MRLVSVSSHVALGHVGNAALAFPLQRLGAEPLAVPTVAFSNHPGYGRFGGGPLPSALVAGMLEGLEAGGALAEADGFLSGYLGEAANAAAVARAVRAMKAARPRAPYLLDPVMGDRGPGLYVRPGVPEAMASLLPLADLATPNLFELEVLGGRPLPDSTAAVAAARGLGPAAVLVTSAESGPDRAAVLLVADGEAWRLSTPRLEFAVAPNGAGDLLAGLWLFEILSGAAALPAARQALARLFALLLATQRHGGRELALVAGQEALVAAEPDLVEVSPCP